ncbi:hypothetical protein BASA81_009522 [Batrachochytrium salamandrivorans]|nr:hypothetical protein BASA81_009522 [Batrachochytrium salamandrivorans]
MQCSFAYVVLTVKVHVGRPDGDDVPAEQVESVASEPLETAGAAAGPAAVLLAALQLAGGGFPSNAKGARMMQDHSGCAAAGPNEAAQDRRLVWTSACGCCGGCNVVMLSLMLILTLVANDAAYCRPELGMRGRHELRIDDDKDSS